MRNLLGGLLATIIGALFLTQIANLELLQYPEPYQFVEFILTGCVGLRFTLLEIIDPRNTIPYLLTWLLIGIITGVFSKSRWNSIRTALWVGVIISLAAIASVLLTDPTFWVSADRNLSLVILFTGTAVTSMLEIPTAIMVVIVKERIQREQELPPPEKIETICVCGAVFKSNPLMCSECGAKLSVVGETDKT
ncbi:MAG: hypothetical protein ACFFAY_07130 [Promethearchaeota archaeon]